MIMSLQLINKGIPARDFQREKRSFRQMIKFDEFISGDGQQTGCY